jgi:hypothetical protein
MQDVIYLAAMVLFFPVAFCFVAGLDRLIGADKVKEIRLARPARATQKVQIQPQPERVTAA